MLTVTIRDAWALIADSRIHLRFEGDRVGPGLSFSGRTSAVGRFGRTRGRGRKVGPWTIDSVLGVKEVARSVYRGGKIYGCKYI